MWLYQPPAAMGGRAETSDSTAGTWSAQMGKKASGNRNSTKLLVLILWRCKLGLCLNNLCILQPPAWFERNLNHLGAGAFELTPRRLPFERVAAADQQTILTSGNRGQVKRRAVHARTRVLRAWRPFYCAPPSPKEFAPRKTSKHLLSISRFARGCGARTR
jgi:hypothetical protein